MTKCTTENLSFSPLNRKKVQANFNGGSVTSDGGLLLLREIDKKIGLTEQLGQVIKDNRHPGYVHHSAEDMLRQRVYAIAAGYEDVNDHDALNKDLCFQTAVGREVNLASSSTLSRFENAIDQQSLVEMSKVFVEQFIQSHSTPPEELLLDFDPTDNVLHGDQENKHYHGYYKAHCFLPLHVFCGDDFLVSLLRPSNIDGSKHAGAILKLLVDRFRTVWPTVKISFRGDAAFARKHIMYWCETNNVEYIVGFAKNKRIEKLGAALKAQAETQYEATETKQRLFDEFSYQAGTWKQARRIIVKAEHQRKGSNFRCIVTNKKGTDAQALYEQSYCPRGDMENGIKQLKLDLHSDRNSCHDFTANHFRLLLSSAAYVLLNALRNSHLSGTTLAKAYCGTLRLKLLKIGAVVVKNTRRIQFFLSSHSPHQNDFTKAARSLVPI